MDGGSEWVIPFHHFPQFVLNSNCLCCSHISLMYCMLALYKKHIFIVDTLYSTHTHTVRIILLLFRSKTWIGRLKVAVRFSGGPSKLITFRFNLDNFQIIILARFRPASVNIISCSSVCGGFWLVTGEPLWLGPPGVSTDLAVTERRAEMRHLGAER